MRIKKLFASVLAGAMALSTMIMPSSAATGDVTDGIWNGMIAFQGFATNWEGWNYVCTEYGSGALTLSTTVQELMDLNGINQIEEVDYYTDPGFGGFKFEIWAISADDDIMYTLSIDGQEIESGVYDTSSDGVWVYNTYAFQTWGTYSMDDPDMEISVSIIVNSYTATTSQEINDDIIENYDGYTIYLETSDGKTGEVSGNTYYVDSETGTAYIAVDVKDVPGDVYVWITDVEFTTSD